ncbi:unnamed protein product [Prorocentrum cordatum]|uniref:Uncharacterized protein n=1 Tax=Prorocentrum cordatum TaxID=2364126 RepID=A0ABN9WUF6_9DINO|nr:unnamed protein product [Polarella glacialis]
MHFEPTKREHAQPELKALVNLKRPVIASDSEVIGIALYSKKLFNFSYGTTLADGLAETIQLLVALPAGISHPLIAGMEMLELNKNIRDIDASFPALNWADPACVGHGRTYPAMTGEWFRSTEHGHLPIVIRGIFREFEVATFLGTVAPRFSST